MEGLVVWIIRIAKFGVLLGILVFVHELGHFLLARRFGVYIKKFFLGFDIGGLKIFSFKRKETEYGIGILPLGGYVKMAGQEDLPPGDEEAREKLEEEDKDISPERRFDRKPLHQRAAIVLAGPLMNLILGLVVFILIAMIGVPAPRDTGEALIGLVEKGLPADKAGLRAGDRIVRVDGEEVKDWNDLNWKLRFSDPGVELSIILERDGERLNLPVTPEKFRGANYPRIGISSGGTVTVWEIQTETPGAETGLRAGDIITSVNGTPVFTMFLDRLIDDHTGDTVPVGVYRPGTEENIEIDLPAVGASVIPGLYLDGNRVLNVDYRADEEIRRLKKGDRVVAIEGEEIAPEEVSGRIASAPPGSVLELAVHRAGWMFFKPAVVFTVRTAVSPITSLQGEGITLAYLGKTDLVRYSGLEAVRVGAGMALESVEKMVSVFYLMLVGKLGTSEVAGPVRIFTITSQVHGLTDLLYLLALISINLGIINLFPLPVLDGGHLLFFLFEAVIRRPLSPRFLLVAQQVGLAAIAILFVLITYRDILNVLGY